MKKKKINLCFFSPRLYPLLNELTPISFGGAEVQIFQVFKEISKNPELNISIITGDLNIKNTRNETYRNVQVFVSIPLKPTILNFIKRPILSLLSLIKINPDVTIIRGAGLPSLINLFPFLFSKLFRKKFIFSIASKRETTGEISYGIIGKFYKYILMHSDAIISQNEEQNNYLTLWINKISKKRIIVIKNAFAIKETNLNKNGSILWVGRAIKLKRPEIFVNLVKKYPNQKFVMICRKDVDENIWINLLNITRNINNLEFFTKVNFSKINEFFAKAKVFINTSTYEGFPNTFVQALINGTPIISLNVDPDNFLVENKCGFNCYDDINNLYLNLERLLNDKELYNTYSNNCIDYALKNHDIKKMIQKWIKLIKSIVL